MPAALVVCERGVRIAYTYDDLMRFHGGHSPGGVAHAFKVLERALPLLAQHGPSERREIAIRTAFGGPGARDGFELVTRAVSDGRYVVDAALTRPGLGRARERFIFELAHRDRVVTLALRDGFVTEELLDLARKEPRSPEEEARLASEKRAMADRVMARPAVEVYDVV